ncbi:Hypothetical predicted protein [Mytilus galloprovincialis]|uniref:Uncharacterized protein n=1 Tax=Mytilus galloprovincialis TaxID=29158 RepID=A0A8B6EBN5_MYTGA|nr:Hypothetical predicted protein [Mytilus galloprovincialis]
MQTVNKEMNNGAVKTNHDNTSYDNGSKPELHVQSLPPWEEEHHDEIEEEQPRVNRLLVTNISVQPSAVAFYAQLSTSNKCWKASSNSI